MTALTLSKPCELPCEKCGNTDVGRQFHKAGETLRAKEYGRAGNRFASAETWCARVFRDHIAHHCRCCHYEWQTLPMKKPRKAKAEA